MVLIAFTGVLFFLGFFFMILFSSNSILIHVDWWELAIVILFYFYRVALGSFFNFFFSNFILLFYDLFISQFYPGYELLNLLGLTRQVLF